MHKLSQQALFRRVAHHGALPLLLTLLWACSSTGGPGTSSASADPDLPTGGTNPGFTVELSNTVVEGAYTLEVQAGTPPQRFQVVADTGSANLALLGDSSLCGSCGSVVNQTTYDPSQSSTAHLGSPSFSNQYGSGSLKIRPVTDRVTVGGATPFSYTFGVITEQQHMQNILGLAYKTVAAPRSNPQTPFFDALVAEAGIADAFSMLWI